MFLFSLIVPVYNVEKYVETCILSITNQSFNDFELIIVDDGSKDSSMDIVRRILVDFPNVKIITQQNKGLSAARNVGIQEAKGSYLIFIDSDDYLNSNYDLENAALQIQKSNFPDIVFHEETRLFNKNVLHYENNIKKIRSKLTYDFINDVSILIYNEILVASAWDKIVKREILTKNDIFFPIGFKSEDMLWTSRLMAKISTYACLDFSMYVYRKNVNNSITKSVNEKHIFDVINMLEEGVLNKDQLNDEIVDAFWSEHFAFLMMNSDAVVDKKRLFWSVLNKYKYLLQLNRTINVDRVYKFYKLFGLKITCFLLVLYRKKNNFNRKYQFIHE